MEAAETSAAIEAQALSPPGINSVLSGCSVQASPHLVDRRHWTPNGNDCCTASTYRIKRHQTGSEDIQNWLGVMDNGSGPSFNIINPLDFFHFTVYSSSLFLKLEIVIFFPSCLPYPVTENHDYLYICLGYPPRYSPLPTPLSSCLP